MRCSEAVKGVEVVIAGRCFAIAFGLGGLAGRGFIAAEVALFEPQHIGVPALGCLVVVLVWSRCLHKPRTGCVLFVHQIGLVGKGVGELVDSEILIERRFHVFGAGVNVGVVALVLLLFLGALGNVVQDGDDGSMTGAVGVKGPVGFFHLGSFLGGEADGSITVLFATKLLGVDAVQ